MLSPVQSHLKLNLSQWLQVGSNLFGQRLPLPEAAGCPALLYALLSISTFNHLLETGIFVFMASSENMASHFKTVSNKLDQHNYLQIISDLLATHMLLAFGNATAFWYFSTLQTQLLIGLFPVVIYFLLSPVSFQKMDFKWICALYIMYILESKVPKQLS